MATTTFDTALAVLLTVAEQGGSGTATAGTISAKYHRYDHESACGGSVFRVRFRNGPTGRSRVDHVLIDGRPVQGAAKALDRFAARREINRIEITDCGRDPLRPVFRGVLGLGEPESQLHSKQNTLSFRLVRQGKGWRMTID